VENKTDESKALKDEAKPEDSVVTNGKTALIVKEEEPLSIDDFHNNDNKILSVLNEAGSNYSFKGLMRKLNLHQQSLSRALHRLEEMGIVEKSPVGYRLSDKTAIVRTDLPAPKGREYTQLLQTYIPVSVKAGEIVRHLVGRWFKNLRWIGMIESGTGYTLQWASDDGTFQINLRMISDYIVIETNALTEKEKVQSMVGSYAIYEQITKAMQSRLGTYTDRQLFAPSHSNN
jgi:DNA-binding transcriptional ArsR family regulator